MKRSLLMTAVLLLAFHPAQSCLARVSTTCVSVGIDGKPGSNGAGWFRGWGPSISADGHFVAFTSSSANLVLIDRNYQDDVFVRDMWAGKTEIVSLTSGGEQASGSSECASISADGRYVAFESWASNLTPAPSNQMDSVFVRDRLAGTTTCLSLSMDGTPANGRSGSPCISADGTVVAFMSDASNLVPGDTNSATDVYVRNVVTGTISIASIAVDGAQGNNWSAYPAISADGRYVAFESLASNLVPDDTNGASDVFVRDMLLGITKRVSVATDGTQGTADTAGDGSFQSTISPDGRYVAYTSYFPNLVANDTNGVGDVFVRDTVAGTTTCLPIVTGTTQANANSIEAHFSADRRLATFTSSATNLVPSDTNKAWDIFLYDAAAGTTSLVSQSLDGVPGNLASTDSVISADGRYVAFISSASNLVTGDTNYVNDIFVRGPLDEPSFTLADVVHCLQVAAGFSPLTQVDASLLNFETGNPAVTLADAVQIARRVVGLDGCASHLGHEVVL